ncbi:MAG: membrane protein [Silanimonas sp.]|nr:MAG: membrane protein [Silanimonas sp.]
MNRRPIHGLALLALAAAGSVPAQYRGEVVPVTASGSENVTYAYAQVIRVDPVYETVRTRVPEERCDGELVRDGGDPTGGTVIGAIAGAALGNQVGKGDGRKAATVAGAIVGGAIGRNIDRNDGSASRGGCRIVEVERESRRVASYDVEYVHQGKTYMSRLPYDPGDRLRVRVSVTPVDEGIGYR